MMEFHPHEVKILKTLKEKSTPEDIAKKTGLAVDAVLRAASWLSTKNLVKVEESIDEEVRLDAEGRVYLKEGLPERQIINAIGEGGSLADLKSKVDENLVNIGLGWLRKKKLATLEGGIIKVVESGKTADETLLEKIGEKERVLSSELNEELKEALSLLKSRKNVITVSEKKNIFFIPTKEGLSIAPSLKAEEVVSQLTPELLVSGGWKDRRIRPYDIGVYVTPKFPAKKHPLQQAIEEIRDIFVGMGFSEIKGPLIESSFWNFDALFTAQDHPVRDMQDTFYLKHPKEVDIPDYDRLRDAVKSVHEGGWTTGSCGWKYKWVERKAREVILRTHTTAVTARYLSKVRREDLPVKVFCIGKVFRNEAVDYKHLPEFFQVEGIVVDENASFVNLLGILKRFYDKMGFQVRFRPAYFPYTEMSVEPEVYFKPKEEWIELGGAGIFRPEVVKPLLGFDCPVLAWGLGLDRVVALKMGLTDIRELYLSDLDWLKKSRIT